MTITADQVSLPLDKPDVDQRPGSSDVAWAERAYHHEHREATNERRRASRAGRRRWRTPRIALAVLFLTTGLVLVMRYQGSAPASVTHPATSSQTVIDPPTTIARSPFTLTAPMISPLLPLSSTINAPRR